MSDKIKLLLVEDRLEDAELLVHALKSTGIEFDYVRVDNEKDYIHNLNDKPDIIISDYSLPQFSGLEALRLLKERDYLTPFILVSGTIGEETAVLAMKAGANDYIMKKSLHRLPIAIKRELEEVKIAIKLNEAEDRYQQLVEFSPISIFIQCEEKIVFLNKAACDLLGASELSQIIGKSIFDIIHSDNHKLVKSWIEEVQTNKSVTKLIEDKYIRLDGSLVDVEVMAAPFQFMNKASTQIFVTDISERKLSQKKIEAQNTQLKKYINRNKRLRYADLMKTEFITNTSHELRTPMNAIIGFSELLKDGLIGYLTPKQQEYCANIYKSGMHLLALINDILDLSKVDAGKMELEIESVDLKKTLEDSLIIVKERALKHQVQLKLDVSDDLGFSNYDSRKLKQIIYNLLSNAVKFAPSKSTVTLKAQITSNEIFEFCVKDMGVGISKENVKRLFRPFEQIQASSGSDSREKGTGLGLTIAKRLVQLHSGDIHVESILGQGTTFTVRLPYLHTKKMAEQRISSLNLQSSFSPRALVIEDDPAAAELIGFHLKELGIEMILKKSVEEALKSEFDEVPALIILEILLPGISGVETMSILKSHKVLANVPIIVVSVAANENKGTIVGTVDFLQKPLSHHQLVTTIRKYIKEDKLNQNVNIFVADDNPKNIEILKKALESLPCKVTTVYDGAQALNDINNESPDIFFIDLLMPNMNGFEVIVSLRNQPKTSEIPIIILTSNSLTKLEQEQLETDVINIMKKDGFTPERFRQEVRRIVLG